MGDLAQMTLEISSGGLARFAIQMERIGRMEWAESDGMVAFEGGDFGWGAVGG